ncbi:MAG: ATP-binding protein [Bacteroidota bacterium]
MRSFARYAAVAVFLALVLAGTMALRTWRAEQVDARGDALQREATAQAHRVAEREMRTLEADVVRRAEALARDPVVVRVLQMEDWETAERLAVDRFAALDLPDGLSAELYTAALYLMAWNGQSFPLGSLDGASWPLAERQVGTVSDGTVRQGLDVWIPVRRDERVLGAVRLTQLVRARVPVRNRYLRDVDLTEDWKAAAGLPFEVYLGAQTSASEGAPRRAVRSLDGAVLAYVEVPPPAVPALQGAVRSAMDDMVAFWTVLLAGWGIAGLWLVHRWMARRAERVRGQSAWRTWGPDVGVLLGISAAWWGCRYLLLALDVPARWLVGSRRSLGGLESDVALFDPAYLASGVGGGVLGSAGELVVTVLFAVLFGAAWLHAAVRVLRWRRREERTEVGSSGSLLGWMLGGIGGAALSLGIIALFALLVQRSVLDAALPYFDRTGPLPEGLVVVVFGALLLLAFAAVALMSGLAALVRVGGGIRFLGGIVLAACALAAAYRWTALGDLVPWWCAAGFFGVAGFNAWWLERGWDAWADPLALRGTLFGALLLTALTYPVLYEAADQKQRARIEDAARDFIDGEDARVAFALEGVLLDARASGTVREALLSGTPGGPSADGPGARTRSLDSLATDLVTGSLLAALADYDVSLSFLSPAGDTLGLYGEVTLAQRSVGTAGGEAPGASLSFQTLRRRYTADSAPGFVIEREPVGGGKYRYAGVGPVRLEREVALLGWVMARAEPKPARYVSETPFPRVLVPAGLAGIVESELAYAEFRDGVLVRTRGSDYGRFRLPSAVAAALRDREAVWYDERVEGAPTRVYYLREAQTDRVTAVRDAGALVFDHLYFYLRLLLPALALALGFYALGLVIRRRADVLVRRSRLRDRVLNRFLLVGLASVAVTGLIGQEVVMTQNRQAVEERLKRQLTRVEAALSDEAGGSSSLPLYSLIDKTRPDVIGPRLGLDVNLYRGADLVASSRSQLVRQQLIDRRLPVEVYERLYIDGERYAFAEEHIGTFTYTTGYEALPDSAGRTGGAIAVPTLPEQIAIEAEQARMVAYLFGVLLLLLVGIFLITTLLANDLTRPFRRLRAGLLAIGAGQGGEPIPVETRDEVGEVIETFNAMQYQLEESRRKLAQQERELAWREMARQVAHEIKNPLTPMKLSVQHLRRAHRDQAATTGGTENGRFGSLLDRITGTLIEQIDALTRIANEFSSFARLPERHLERLDLGDVVREAAALLGEEEHAEIVLALGPAPLPVMADREELRRVYINLFKNALQAMPETERGTITVRTEQRVEEDAVWAWSAVRDTGTGIPEEARAKVFQPNFSTKTSGMGLGLAITKKAIEDLRGEIRFETELGAGTTFFVQLPLAEV